jgi:hypothetical protein
MWLESSSPWICAAEHGLSYWREEDRLRERSKNSGWPMLKLFISSIPSAPPKAAARWSELAPRTFRERIRSESSPRWTFDPAA